jgi:hypothetical protein
MVLGNLGPHSSELIKSSWAEEWAAYDSPEEALLAAAEHVAQLSNAPNPFPMSLCLSR